MILVRSSHHLRLKVDVDHMLLVRVVSRFVLFVGALASNMADITMIISSGS